MIKWLNILILGFIVTNGTAQLSKEASFDVNTHYDEYAPGYIANKFVYCSNRRDNTFSSYVDRKGVNRTQWYTIDEKGKEKKFEIPNMRSFYQVGPFSWNAERNELCFTASSFLRNGEDAILGLYFVTLNSDGSWTRAMPYDYNSKELKYSVGQPTYSNGGDSLYFVSDLENGEGGTDIYIATREGDNWSEPKNLGSGINSADNEYYPTLNADGSLCFSSDRNVETKDYDIYKSRFTSSQWLTPVALEAPFNTKHDDFSLVDSKNGESSFLVSNRSILSLNIYEFKQDIPTFDNCRPVEAPAFCYYFYEEGIPADQELPLKYIWNFGDGTKGEGLSLEHCYADYGEYNVSLSLIDTLRNAVYGVISQFQVSVIPTGKPHLYEESSIVVDKPTIVEPDFSELKSGRIIKRFWFVDGNIASKAELLEYTFTEKGFHEVKLGVVYEDEDGFREELCNSIVVQVEGNEPVQDDVVIDQNDLGEEVAMTVKRSNDQVYFVEFFESEWQVSKSDPLFEEVPYSITERLTSDSSYHYSVGEESSPYALYDTYVDMVEKGFDESKIKGEELAEFRKQILSEGGYVYDQEKKQMLSFVQSLADIQFAMNSDQILEESLPNLVKVSEILMIDEGFRLFISAHTDNVGDDDYNMELSQRRALAVYDFLVARGIEPERMRTKGFGESKPVETNATEAGRKLNRRVEFRLFFVEG